MNPRVGFIGIGGQKCASSWIFNVLGEHPEIVTSRPKELDFFSRNYDRGYQWYERHFQDEGLAGEISPSYLCDGYSPERAAHYNPGLKIIVALRDPIERAYSNHLHEIRGGNFAGTDISFGAGLANNPMYEFQSLYGLHLRKWFRNFPRESIHCVLQEEIQQDPSAAARELYEFLGITPDFRASFVGRRSNESVAPRIAWIDNAVRGAARMARRARFGHVVNLVKNAPGISALWQANKIDYRQRVPALTDYTRRELAERFREDLTDLARLLGREKFPWPTWRLLFADKAT